MRTVDRRAQLRLQETIEPPFHTLTELAVLLRPTYARPRRGEWRVLITGPRTARQREEASLFQARLMELADVLEARH